MAEVHPSKRERESITQTDEYTRLQSRFIATKNIFNYYRLKIFFETESTLLTSSLLVLRA